MRTFSSAELLAVSSPAEYREPLSLLPPNADPLAISSPAPSALQNSIFLIAPFWFTCADGEQFITGPQSSRSGCRD
jgi:hypothetical protein